ncbi:MAG: type II secretion system protein GspG [Planctomycetota bacterium]
MKRVRGSGFVEAIVLIALLAAAAAVALPMWSVDLRQEFVKETTAEIAVLRRGVECYFEDLKVLPTALSDLQNRPSGSTTWRGPYVSPGFVDEDAASLSVGQDAWTRDYLYSTSGSYTVTIRSKGHDGIDDGGAGDDISDTFSVHTSGWEITRRELGILQGAITAYNNAFAPNWLPHTWSSIVSALQTSGLLPPGTAWKSTFKRDAWNQIYIPEGCPINTVVSLGPP